MNKLALLSIFLALPLAAQTTVCLAPPGTVALISIVPCPAPAAPSPITAAAITALFQSGVVQAIASLPTGSLFVPLPDGVSGLPICIAGTASTGCPAPSTSTTPAPLASINPPMLLFATALNGSNFTQWSTTYLGSPAASQSLNQAASALSQ